jgi:ribosomal protein S24E
MSEKSEKKWYLIKNTALCFGTHRWTTFVHIYQEKANARKKSDLPDTNQVSPGGPE